MPRKIKKLTPREKKFALLLSEGVKPVEAARSVFGWKCEHGTAEAQKARDLARAKRVKDERKRLEDQDKKEAEAATLASDSSKSRLDWSNLRAFAFSRLEDIRDDKTSPSRARFAAVKALEKLSDPTKDINLIYRWIDVLWRYYTAHCPCCHVDVPLWKIKNEKLAEYRQRQELLEGPYIEDPYQRRIEAIKEADKGTEPHIGQVRVLSAPERHICATGAARAGKSYCLGMFGYLFALLPGVEVWILARVYDEAYKEFEYIEKFLRSLFYPLDNEMIKTHYDKVTGEAWITTRWGTEIMLKSGKAKGSITGHELEAGLVAEPAWVDGDLYEEFRARMSSRLGRIIALGTPKGFGGFIHRMTKTAGRNAATGKRMKPEDRLIANGSPWEQSIYLGSLSPEENPTYVKSEIETARMELTEEEFASEFEGKMMHMEGAKFPFITPAHLVDIDRGSLRRCSFVLGVDQGPRNFGSVLLGWDGSVLRVLFEYFDNTDATEKMNMIKLNNNIPLIIANEGGDVDDWKLTIFDADPPVIGILEEMKQEGNKWRTQITERPKNVKGLNWRAETTMFINNLARQDRIQFSSKNCDMLHDQLLEVLNKPNPEGKETIAGRDKGWIVKDPWRKDHVLDAFMLACYTIFNEELEVQKTIVPSNERVDGYEEARKVFEYRLRRDEQRELQGFGYNTKTEKELFNEFFDSPEEEDLFTVPGLPSYYSDEG